MQYSTVTQKGQITIPIDIRRALEINEGDRVALVQTGNNSITITVSHKVDLMSLGGCLPKPNKILSIEEMNSIIANQPLK